MGVGQVEDRVCNGRGSFRLLCPLAPFQFGIVYKGFRGWNLGHFIKANSSSPLNVPMHCKSFIAILYKCSLKPLLEDGAKKGESGKTKGKEEKKGTTWRGMWEKTRMLWPYMWPKKNVLHQLRIVFCLLILIAARGITVLIPIYYKKISEYREVCDLFLSVLYQRQIVSLGEN